MEIRPDPTRDKRIRIVPLPAAGRRKVLGVAALALVVIAPTVLMSGCMMTPEDKAFYGRGWINPDELDQEPPPPQNFQDPTAVQPHMMGPGDY
jgi:hypothetical protein